MTTPASRDYHIVLNRVHSALGSLDSVTTLHRFMYGPKEYEVIQITLGKGNPKRVLISAGIHGDEPAGVETMCRFLEERHYREWLTEWELVLIPCINPVGYERGTREDHQSRDLNRLFHLKDPGQPVRAIQGVLETPFLLDLELHEDVDSPGYYLYQKEHLPATSPLGRRMLDAVVPIMPLNLAETIEELPAREGILDRLSEPDEMDWWPMVVYAYAQQTRHVFTMETSTQFPMDTRVEAHLSAINAALNFFQ